MAASIISGQIVDPLVGGGIIEEKRGVRYLPPYLPLITLFQEMQFPFVQRYIHDVCQP